MLPEQSDRRGGDARATRGWVAYAQEHKAILLYDAAYEGYISDPEIPRSIFEIPGATECAVEFRSFSKTGGFTGVRCGFTVMTKRLLRTDERRTRVAAAPALASALEHESEQRELPGAARRGSALQRGGPRDRCAG